MNEWELLKKEIDDLKKFKVCVELANKTHDLNHQKLEKKVDLHDKLLNNYKDNIGYNKGELAELREELTKFQTKYPYTTAHDNSRQINELKEQVVAWVDDIRIGNKQRFRLENVLKELISVFEMETGIETGLLSKLDGSESKSCLNCKNKENLGICMNCSGIDKWEPINDGEKSVSDASRKSVSQGDEDLTDSTPSKYLKTCCECEMEFPTIEERKFHEQVKHGLHRVEKEPTEIASSASHTEEKEVIYVSSRGTFKSSLIRNEFVEWLKEAFPKDVLVKREDLEWIIETLQEMFDEVGIEYYANSRKHLKDLRKQILGEEKD